MKDSWNTKQTEQKQRDGEEEIKEESKLDKA